MSSRDYQRGNLLRRREVYSGKIVDLVVDHIEFRGRESIREVIHHPGGVVVIAEVEPDRIPFVRQHRYPMEKVLLELPAGKLDRGEDPALSAARELVEETGFQAESLEHVCSFYTSPGFCDELLWLYYTDRVQVAEMNLEHDEDLTVEYYSLNEAIPMCLDGRIADAKTILALFWLHWKRQSL